MSKMHFGTFHLFSKAPWMSDRDVLHHELEQTSWLDDMGFEEAWLAEHNARVYGIVGSLQVAAAAVASRTKKVRIGAAVTRVPLHHPLHTAEDLAAIDVMSDGRLDWGIGKGYDPLEFETYGVPFSERDARWEEAIHIIFTLWKEGHIKHEGKFWTIPEVELLPKPVQKPMPPVFMMVTQSDASVEFAGKNGLPVILGQGPDWDDAKRKIALYRATARTAGRPEAETEALMARTAQLKMIHIADSSQQARDEFEKGLMWYFQTSSNRGMFGFNVEPQPYDYYLNHRSVMLGTAQEVLDQIQEYKEYTGIPGIVCWFNCGGQPHDRVRRTMDAFSSKVMPKL
ncbi:MAG: LLM class flavin-dependent oxidoreductase [Dehalococcoidia bacterium]|nr:LLM class flavin-dependent oxidoreductase [Dehalococcoidia bacterium]